MASHTPSNNQSRRIVDLFAETKTAIGVSVLEPLMYRSRRVDQLGKCGENGARTLNLGLWTRSRGRQPHGRLRRGDIESSNLEMIKKLVIRRGE